MQTCIDPKAEEPHQIQQWRNALSKYQHGIIPVGIDGPGSAIEPGIAPTLNEVLQRLCHVDYAMRDGVLSVAFSRIRSMIRLLENEAEFRRRLEAQRALRRKRLEKVKEKDRRIDALKNRGEDRC